MIAAKRFIVTGRVQGVGYRWFASRAAYSRSVSGWARNLPDGSVELHAQGTDSALLSFEAALGQGPMGAFVDDIEYHEASAQEDLEGFDIR